MKISERYSVSWTGVDGELVACCAAFVDLSAAIDCAEKHFPAGAVRFQITVIGANLPPIEGECQAVEAL